MLAIGALMAVSGMGPARSATGSPAVPAFLSQASGAWSSMPSGTVNNLNAIWGNSASDVFAVGMGGTIVHYDGSAWGTMPSGTTADLSGVWGASAYDVFALEYDGDLLRYDGSAWTPFASGPLPTDPDSFPHFAGIWVSPYSELFVVGRGRDDFNGPHAGVFRYDRTWNSWSTSTLLGGDSSYLNGIYWSSPTDIFAVGGDDVGGYILHCGESTWDWENTGDLLLDARLTDVWGSSSSGVFAVGAGMSNWDTGVILRRDISGSWTYMTGGPHALEGVWGSSATNVFAVGGSGTIMHCDGSTCTPMTSSTINRLNGVWGSSSSDVFAVGESGTILHYQAAPTVSSISPDRGTQGQTLNVTIAGTGFTGASGVSFGAGITAAIASVDAPTQITAAITIDAAAALGPREVSVTTPGGTDKKSGAFTVEAATPPPPAITSVAPPSGLQGQSLTVVVSGTSLTGAGDMTFGQGISVTGSSVDSDIQVTVSITIDAAAELGPRNVSLTTPGGTATRAGGFTVGTPPAITSVAPASGYQGQTLSITISLTSLNTPTSVSLGPGITVTGYAASGATQVTASIAIDAAAVPGPREISVVTGEGTAAKPGGFEVLGPPTITSVAPGTGNPGQTLSVVITGTYLSGATAVSFGQGISVTGFNADSATQITANMVIDPAAELGTKEVRATTPGGTASASSFTVATMPAIVSVSPGSGMPGQTRAVTITGSGFSDVTAISFGQGVVVTDYIVNSASQIAVNIAIDAAAGLGSRDVSVTTPGGTATRAGAFTVGKPPAVTPGNSEVTSSSCILQLTGSVSSDSGKPTEVAYRIDGVDVWYPATSLVSGGGGSGACTYTVQVFLPPGTHTVELRATDSAGRTTPQESYAVVQATAGAAQSRLWVIAVIIVAVLVVVVLSGLLVWLFRRKAGERAWKKEGGAAG